MIAEQYEIDLCSDVAYVRMLKEILPIRQAAFTFHLVSYILFFTKII